MPGLVRVLRGQAAIVLSASKWRGVYDMLRWAKPGKERDHIMKLVDEAAGNEPQKPTEVPESLRKFLAGVTPEEADELWNYFDSCDVMAMIEIVARKSPNFVEAQDDYTEWQRDRKFPKTVQ